MLTWCDPLPRWGACMGGVRAGRCACPGACRMAVRRVQVLEPRVQAIAGPRPSAHKIVDLGAGGAAAHLARGAAGAPELVWDVPTFSRPDLCPVHAWASAFCIQAVVERSPCADPGATVARAGCAPAWDALCLTHSARQHCRHCAVAPERGPCESRAAAGRAVVRIDLATCLAAGRQLPCCAQAGSPHSLPTAMPRLPHRRPRALHRGGRLARHAPHHRQGCISRRRGRALGNPPAAHAYGECWCVSRERWAALENVALERFVAPHQCRSAHVLPKLPAPLFDLCT